MINTVTKKPYQGGNVDLLAGAIEANGFTSPEFGTFPQFKKLGRMVQKGQKGIKLIKMVKKEVPAANGKTIEKLVPVSFTVFNIEQTKILEAEVAA